MSTASTVGLVAVALGLVAVAKRTAAAAGTAPPRELTVVESSYVTSSAGLDSREM